MKRALHLLPLILLTACGMAPVATTPAPTPSSTPSVFDLAFGNIQAQGTLEAMQATSQVISANLTSTAYAPTQHVAETATERAWTMAGWTATASIQQTATSASGTATQQSWQATATQRAVDITATADIAAASAHATAMYGEAVSVELAVERERMMNKVSAVVPWAALIIAFGFILVMAYRWARVRPVQRDARGDAPLLVIDGKVYDADRNPYPLVDMSGKKPQIPVLTPPELQLPTTARDQMLDLATRGTPSSEQRRAVARRLSETRFAPTQPGKPVLPPIEVVDAVEVKDWIEEAEQKLLTDGGIE